MDELEIAAEEYANFQCEDLGDQSCFSGMTWFDETKFDFLEGAKSDAAREYHIKELSQSYYSQAEVIHILDLCARRYFKLAQQVDRNPKLEEGINLDVINFFNNCGKKK